MRACLFVLILLVGTASAEPSPGPFALPLPGACISSPFGARHADQVGPQASSNHRGIDLPGPAGAWVVASATGQVVSIRRIGATGLMVELRHEDGLTTRYAHLGSLAPALANGRRRVARGERLGRIGRTGVTYGTHVHFELLQAGAAIDPAPYLSVAPCR